MSDHALALYLEMLAQQAIEAGITVFDPTGTWIVVPDLVLLEAEAAGFEMPVFYRLERSDGRMASVYAATNGGGA